MKESLGDNDVDTGRMPLSWVRYCRHILMCQKIFRFLSCKYTNIKELTGGRISEEKRKVFML